MTTIDRPVPPAPGRVSGLDRVVALPVQGPTLLRIERLHAGEERPHALRLAAGVPLEVNGRRSNDLVLRTSTAPRVVEVLVHALDATVVYLWHTWTIDGVEHAWLGRAGIRLVTDLTGADPVLRLACRDGLGDPIHSDHSHDHATPDDLVVALTVRPAPAARVDTPATGTWAAGTAPR